MSKYEEQLAVAEALDQLAQRALDRLARRDAYVDHMRNAALAQNRDFYTLVVADVLGLDYYEVMAVERRVAKELLFVFTYGGDAKVTRIHDAVIIDRRSGP